MSRLGPATLVVIVAAIVLGLAGAFGARQLFRAAPARLAAAPEPAPQKKFRVPFAIAELPAFRKIAASDVSSRELTREQLRDLVAKKDIPQDAPLDFRYVVGRYLRKPVGSNKAFSVAELFPEGVEPSLSERLKPGQRAVTVAIRNVAATGGFALPGSFVDLLFRSKKEESKSIEVPEVTLTLLENVEVLALDSSSFPGTPSRPSVRSVTLAVSPEQAQILQVVEGKGELSLAMRSPGAEPLGNVPDRLSLEKLLGLVPKPAPPPPAPVYTVETYRGTTRQTISFVRPTPGQPGQLDTPPAPTPAPLPRPSDPNKPIVPGGLQTPPR